MKTLKVPLDPTSEQEESIDHNIEANRYAYNNFITACKSNKEKGLLPPPLLRTVRATFTAHGSSQR